MKDVRLAASSVPTDSIPLGKPPRLILRFALYTGVGIALAASSILMIVRHFERGSAERSATLYARQAAELMSERLTRSDFVEPITTARRVELDRLFARQLVRDGTLRVELLDRRGVVTYSSQHSLIGTTVRKTRLVTEALAGTIVSDATSVDEPRTRKHVNALEAYAGIHVDGHLVGVFALAQDYGPIAAAARRTFLPVVGVLELVLLGLYILLFPILRRVTSRLRRQMEVIEHQALHDALTGLPSRMYFQAMVEEALVRSDGHAGVLLVDLDRFKEINDALGHPSGDALLAELGQRLAVALGEGTGVARLGGDEFGVVSEHMLDAASAIAVAERVRETIAEPTEVAGVSVEMQASVGIALAPEHGRDVEELLRRADVAMYEAKNTLAPQLYTPSLDQNSPDRLALVSQLRHALTRDEIVVHYQPQIDLRSGAVRGAEALVRWLHPRRGLIPPDEFLLVAEHVGLMRPLTRYVLEKALEQTRIWHEAGHSLELAVNISGRDLVDSRLPDEVGRALAEHGVPATCLELEITENTLLFDPGRTATILGRLSDLGVRIAIDDFGTGYSSLGHLKRLPVDVLKIDRSFVMRMTSDTSDAMIVRSTIDLAHSLGLTVVAEGVEDADTWQQLSAIGCDIAQGYAISRPLPTGAFAEWLRTNGNVVSLQRGTRIAAVS
jgi:diguanylate cyclase (GGDEF)-like protein